MSDPKNPLSKERVAVTEIPRRKTVAQATAEGAHVEPGRAPWTRSPYETLESERETYWADKAEALIAENADLRTELDRLRNLIGYEDPVHVVEAENAELRAQLSLIEASARPFTEPLKWRGKGVDCQEAIGEIEWDDLAELAAALSAAAQEKDGER